MKRILSIQDLSCLGKCAQTVALPVLSAMGLECVVLPTALLSAHTAFDGFYSRELTDSFAPILAHWRRLGLRFDAIYTGFLASRAQVDLVLDLVEEFGRADTLVFVDPAMADRGALYPGFSADFPTDMARLCRRADVITPNMTEACLLTQTPWQERYDGAFVENLLKKLLNLGPKTAILTGLRTDEGHIGVASLGPERRLGLHSAAYHPSVCHGTGDLFAAVCVGALTRGLPVETATALAAEYVSDTIRVTVEDPEERWYGVNFEQTLPALIERLARATAR